MAEITVEASPIQADRELIAAFRAVPTAIISDNLARLPAAAGLVPFHGSSPMAGTALTVRTREGDNLAIHRALDLARPGDVLVVDGGGNSVRALVGEIVVSIAIARGAAGLVIDGAVRDVAALASLGFPCFARSAIHRGPYKDGPGAINVPVSIGGMVVNPGDIVVGDADGVVAFDPALAADLLGRAQDQMRRETEILAAIREGRLRGVLPAAS